jgi:hypothetical protein
MVRKKASRKEIRSTLESSEDVNNQFKRIGPSDGNFVQHLMDHGIHYCGYKCIGPDNLEEIRESLKRRRHSLSLLSPNNTTFQRVADFNRNAYSEDDTMAEEFAFITGSAFIPHSRNKLFKNLKDLTTGALTQAKPDFYDGSSPNELDPGVRDRLGSYIIPCANKSMPCLPNFLGEAKGPGGSIDICKRQALYYGALSARGMHKLRLHNDPTTSFDNRAYIIVATYLSSSGGLTLYTCHPAQSENPANPVSYHQTELGRWHIFDNADAFYGGITALRNARDWAKEQRNQFIATANEIAKSSKMPGLVEHVESSLSTLEF